MSEVNLTQRQKGLNVAASVVLLMLNPKADLSNVLRVVADDIEHEYQQWHADNSHEINSQLDGEFELVALAVTDPRTVQRLGYLEEDEPALAIISDLRAIANEYERFVARRAQELEADRV